MQDYELPKLTIINPNLLQDTGILLDMNWKLERESDFDENNTKWKLYGNPYETIIEPDGKVIVKYGFIHSIGYIELLENPEDKYDVILGLLIKRIDTDYDSYSECESDYESDSESGLESEFDFLDMEIKTNHYFRNNLLDKKSFFVDCNNLMDFEFGFDDKNIIYKFKGIPRNDSHKYGFEFAKGILISLRDNLRFKLNHGKIKNFN
jgi:hypothetical protein